VSDPESNATFVSEYFFESGFESVAESASVLNYDSVSDPQSGDESDSGSVSESTSDSAFDSGPHPTSNP